MVHNLMKLINMYEKHGKTLCTEAMAGSSAVKESSEDPLRLGLPLGDGMCPSLIISTNLQSNNEPTACSSLIVVAGRACPSGNCASLPFHQISADLELTFSAKLK